MLGVEEEVGGAQDLLARVHPEREVVSIFDVGGERPHVIFTANRIAPAFRLGQRRVADPAFSAPE